MATAQILVGSGCESIDDDNRIGAELMIKRPVSPLTWCVPFARSRRRHVRSVPAYLPRRDQERTLMAPPSPRRSYSALAVAAQDSTS
jgi:hypothetical protein